MHRFRALALLAAGGLAVSVIAGCGGSAYKAKTAPDEFEKKAQSGVPVYAPPSGAPIPGGAGGPGGIPPMGGMPPGAPGPSGAPPAPPGPPPGPPR